MKKFLSLVMALVMTMSLVTIGAGAKDFTDDSKINYKEAIDVMSAIKIIDGNADGSFRPANTLTRGAASKIICNLILGPTTASALGADTAPYKDVPANSMYSGYVAYCSQQGIINGYADGTFRPAGTVTGYQFMKMLLVALGYDGKLEGFTGPNWSVNVAKLAFSIGLNKGNDTFNGAVAMTREEACLYAFNTLKTTMVEYDSTTNIVIGGTQVSVGGSKAKEVTNAGPSAKNNIYADGKMQFAEKYFTKLVRSDNSDDFHTPATKWVLAGKEVGLYSREANLTYTAKVKLGDIYADLGLSEKLAANYYVDGDSAATIDAGKVKAATVDVLKNDSTKIGGNGALTSVYYDSEAAAADRIVITVVNSYLGKINGITAAEKNDKRFVTVTGIGTDAITAQGTFETEEFAKKDYVVFTAAAVKNTSNIDTWYVESLEAAKSVTGVFTSYTGNESEVIGGTTYKNSAKVKTTGAGYSGELKDEVTAYLDSYGYVLDIVTSEAAESSYAYVVNASSDRGSWAKLLFADGKTKIVDTNKTYAAEIGDWVTFRVNSDGQYVLTDATVGDNLNTATVSFKTTSGSAKMTVGGDMYANDSTVFVVEKPAGVYTVYTGYKNVPTIDDGATPGAAVTVKADAVCAAGSTVAKFVFVDASANTTKISGSTKNVIYVVANKSAKHSVDSDSNYYTLEAVVNGEIATLKVDYATFKSTTDSSGVVTASPIAGLVGSSATSMVFSGMTTDKYGVVTLGSEVTGVDNFGTDTGISDVSKGTVTIGSIIRAVNKDTKVFYVNTDGKIFASDIDGVSQDTNDKVIYTLKDGAVNNIFIQQVK